MTRIKPALLWISAIALLVCLGLFSHVAVGQRAHATNPVVAPASVAPADAAAGQSQALPAIPASGEQCGAAASAQPLSLELSSDAPSAACPKGTVHTCCRCGGCGCRPTNISPTNWCAC